MSKVLILTAMHHRPAVSEIFLLSMERIKQKSDINVYVELSWSDDISKEICDKYSVNYWYTENFPVGQKWNMGLHMALQHDFDHLCIMGDDDIAATEVFTILYEENKHKDYFGYQSAYFLSPEKSEAKIMRYKTKKLMGSCRFISKKLLETVAHQVRVIAEGDFGIYKKHQAYYMSLRKAEYFESLKFITIVSEPQVMLWDGKANKGLDMSLELKMTEEGFYSEPVKTYNPLITAVKTENIWNYEQVRGDKAEVSDAIGFMSEQEKLYLGALGLKY